MDRTPDNSPAQHVCIIASDPTRVTEIPAADLPEVTSLLFSLGRMALLQEIKNAASNGHRQPTEDRLLSALEAAPYRGVKPAWFSRHKKETAAYRIDQPGHPPKYSYLGLQKWIKNRRVLSRDLSRNRVR